MGQRKRDGGAEDGGGAPGGRDVPEALLRSGPRGSGRYLGERLLRQVAKAARERGFADEAELNRFMQERFVGKPIDEDLPSDPLERAQEYAFRAMEADQAEDVLEFTEMALDVDPDNADALRLRAEAQYDPENALPILDRAAAVALARLGGPAALAEVRGEAWNRVEWRPYVRVLFARAQALVEAGRVADAVAAWNEVLDLDRRDAQGARYGLQGALLELRDAAAWRRLWMRFEREPSAPFLWGAVLVERIAEDEAAAERALAAAREVNAHVAGLLLAPWERREPPEAYAPGSLEEAEAYLSSMLPAWGATSGALEWLRARTKGAPEVPEETRRACEALRPEGDRGPVPAWLPWVLLADDLAVPGLVTMVRPVRDRAIPWLLRLLGMEDVPDLENVNAGIAPALAARLLGGLRATEAVPALVEAVRAYDPDDLLHDQSVVALGRIGSPAVDPLLTAWQESQRRGDLSAALSFAGALAHAGVGDPRVRPVVVAALDEEPGLGAAYAEAYGDASLLPRLQAAYKRLARTWDGADPDVAGDLVDLGAAIEGLGGSLSGEGAAVRERAVDCRAELARERLEERWPEDLEEEEGEDAEEDDEDDDPREPLPWAEGDLAPPLPPRRDVGRNDPCWCGSGQKYKKCHLERDEAGS